MLHPVARGDVLLSVLHGPLELKAFRRALEVLEGFERQENCDAASLLG